MALVIYRPLKRNWKCVSSCVCRVIVSSGRSTNSANKKPLRSILLRRSPLNVPKGSVFMSLPSNKAPHEKMIIARIFSRAKEHSPIAGEGGKATWKAIENLLTRIRDWSTKSPVDMLPLRVKAPYRPTGTGNRKFEVVLDPRWNADEANRQFCSASFSTPNRMTSAGS